MAAAQTEARGEEIQGHLGYCPQCQGTLSLRPDRVACMICNFPVRLISEPPPQVPKPLTPASAPAPSTSQATGQPASQGTNQAPANQANANQNRRR